MEYVIAAVFDNYINANVTLGRLQEENISCWLKDENTIIVTRAVGGIQLMVAASQLERAQSIIKADAERYREQLSCPQCGSKNIGVVNTPQRTNSWVSAIANLVLNAGAPTAMDKMYHCFDCDHEFEA